ncbi:type II secretion system F family protein [Kitasatospora sp. NBC_01287]|uniref:type II secretion system F family protein n=1 Tax=Kitasatospora sp. NBC_01287 TaxID=2903573 RepID=UPI00225BBF68|nr:type II secretion system F family protein [Kitasatospora sp. NBC_01287]MCX4748125.1 type II secretion system F family protein [Kitasatospora sp. NBC_01287]
MVAGGLLRSPVPPAAAVLLVFPSCRWRERRRAVREERERAGAVIELCAALAGELRSGATPEQALDSVTGPGRATAGLLERLGEQAVARLVAGRYGADVPSALRWLGTLPGGGGGSAIAACWQVTADSGTGLATALEQVAEALRADRALRDEVRSELAGPRTTAVLLAVLPVFGLLLGVALGADPMRVLLHTPLGWGCLAAGVVLELAGLCWSGRIVRGALADPDLHTGAVRRPRERSAGPAQGRAARRAVVRASRVGRRPGLGRGAGGAAAAGRGAASGGAVGQESACRDSRGSAPRDGRTRRSHRRPHQHQLEPGHGRPSAGPRTDSPWWRRDCVRRPGAGVRHPAAGGGLGVSW